MSKITSSNSLLDNPTLWPHYPVCLCSVASPITGSDITTTKYGDGPLPLNVPFAFTSGLFEGYCLVRIRHVKGDAEDKDENYFRGKKRTMQFVIQGRFKEELSVADILTGHEFARPLINLPPQLVLDTFSSLVRRLSPSADITVSQERSKLLAPLVTVMQRISINYDGEQPSIFSHNIEENTSAFGYYFDRTVRAVTPFRRKTYFSDHRLANEYYFDTTKIYTFEFYQDLLDVSSYTVNLGFMTLKLVKYLNGQPIQIMCKTKDDRYLWNFNLWHADLLLQYSNC